MSRIVIMQDDEDKPRAGFSSNHPLFSYVVGDMARGFYVLGCVGLDLFAPLQIHLSFPALDAFLLPPVFAAVVGLAYAELRLYRRLWPASRREVVDVVEGRDP